VVITVLHPTQIKRRGLSVAVLQDSPFHFKTECTSQAEIDSVFFFSATEMLAFGEASTKQTKTPLNEKPESSERRE
jgi:hypothetical protein